MAESNRNGAAKNPLKQAWKALLGQSFEIPKRIRDLAATFMSNTFKKQARAIDFVTDPVDTFQEKEDMSTKDRTTWNRALESGDLTEITRVAALLCIVAFIFSVDSAPRGGSCLFSHSYGPPLSEDDIQKKRRRRVPGDYCKIEWDKMRDFQACFGASSTATEAAGKAIMIQHWWFDQAVESKTRAQELEAEPVIVILGDNSGAVTLVEKDSYNQSAFGPCQVISEVQRKMGIKICSRHLAGKLIPADPPTRLSKPGWQADLRARKHFLGLDEKNRGRCVSPPPEWRAIIGRMVFIQKNYSSSLVA